MKKLTLLAALVCGVSFSSMAADSKVTAPESIIYKSTETLHKEYRVLMKYDNKFAFGFDCYTIGTGCGVDVIACGSTAKEVIDAAVLFESIICG